MEHHHVDTTIHWDLEMAKGTPDGSQPTVVFKLPASSMSTNKTALDGQAFPIMTRMHGIQRQWSQSQFKRCQHLFMVLIDNFNIFIGCSCANNNGGAAIQVSRHLDLLVE